MSRLIVSIKSPREHSKLRVGGGCRVVGERWLVPPGEGVVARLDVDSTRPPFSEAVARNLYLQAWDVRRVLDRLTL